MGRKIYTQADHQSAFETWYKTRNWSTVAKSLDAVWSTTKRWGESDYPCSWSCPWHDYNKLMADRDAAHQARTNLLNEGNYDPVDHDIAIREAVSRKGDGLNSTKNPPAVVIVRADIERLQHWEYLWSKVYFHATGLVTNWSEFQGMTQMVEFERLELETRLRDALKGGLAATSLEQCIRMLKTIQDQIDGLQGSNRRSGNNNNDPGKKEMTIVELRQIRETLKNTPPKKLKNMVAVVESQDAASNSRAS